MNRIAYAAVNLLMIISYFGLWWLVNSGLQSLVYTRSNEVAVISANVALLALFIAVWHVITNARVNPTRLRWLHLAPYLTAISAVGVYILASFYHDDPRTPLWAYLAFYAGLVGLLAWPAASITFSILKGRQNASH